MRNKKLSLFNHPKKDVMKKLLFVSMIVFAIVACKKGDTGPAGPQG
jgi:hypothetical protein